MQTSNQHMHEFSIHEFVEAVESKTIPELLVDCDKETDKVNTDPQKELCFTQNLSLLRHNDVLISASSHLGRRKNQEDRFIIAPNLLNGDLLFCAVYDGTVREHAAEFVKNNTLNVLMNTHSFLKFASLPPETRNERNSARKIFTTAVSEFYQDMDALLLKYCADNDYPYSSCTAVTVFLHFPSQTLYVAHLADSHATLSIPSRKNIGDSLDRQHEEPFLGQFLTRAHRPDMPEELTRITKSGGSLVYLHGNRPFIRGGDFHDRAVAMQLNYSRAFGGKDLKPYGLSAIPDIRVIDTRLPTKSTTDRPGEEVYSITLGSDGIWDVLTPIHASNDVARYLLDYTKQPCKYSDIELPPKNDVIEPRCKFTERLEDSPAERLVQQALDLHIERNSGDNCTAIVLMFKPKNNV